MKNRIVVHYLLTGLLVAAWSLLASPAFAQDVTVTSATPNSASQGTVNLNVTIGGKGFKRGAQAAFFVSGTTDPGGITVNYTTFVGSTQLVANINVADTASTANFDVVVGLADGRTGKGIELFSIFSQGQANAVCTDIPIQAMFVNTGTVTNPDGSQTTVATRIQNDIAAPYEEGVDGIQAVIHVCGTGASHDATVNANLSKNRRGVFSFPAAIPGSSTSGKYAPFAGGSPVIGKFFVNVRNILYNRPGCDAGVRSQYSFTSMMVTDFSYVKTADYRLAFLPPTSDASGPTRSVLPDDNKPFQESYVVVTFHPGDCLAVPDSWTVDGLNWNPNGFLQLGTVFHSEKGTWVQYGQYEMPFKMEIAAKQVF